MNPHDYQVTLLELGWFHTDMREKATFLNVHPAYSKPTLLTMTTRENFVSPNLKYPGDTRKAVLKIYELAHLEEVPLRLALGKDFIASRELSC